MATISRRRCDDRPRKTVINADGTFGAPHGTRVLVADGVILSQVTQGKLRALLRSGVAVDEYAFAGDMSPQDARAAVAGMLAGGPPPNNVCSIRLDLTLASNRVGPALEAIEHDEILRGIEFNLGAVAAYRMHQTFVTPHGAAVRAALALSSDTFTMQSLEGFLAATTDPNMVAVATVLTLRFDLFPAAAMAASADTALGDLLTAAPGVLHARLVLGLPATGDLDEPYASMTAEQIITAGTLVGVKDAPDLATIAGLDQRGLLRLLAGVPPGAEMSNDDWKAHIDNLVATGDHRLVDVLGVVMRGSLPERNLRAYLASPNADLPGLLRLGRQPLIDLALAAAGDLSIPDSDVIALAGRGAAVFGKRTGDVLRMASAMQWSPHDLCSSLPAMDPALGKSFTETLLAAKLTTWASPTSALGAMRVVAAEWAALAPVAHGHSFSSLGRMARAASSLGISWSQTPLGQAIGQVKPGRKVAAAAALTWLSGLHRSSIYPTDTSYIAREGRSVTGSFLARTDGEGLFLGDFTDCCQHIGGAGESCAIDGAINPTSGFFVVRDSSDTIVAQSWVWLSDDSATVCFDNIERLEGALDEDATADLRSGILDVYHQAAEDLAEAWGVAVTVGTAYTDDELLDDLPDVRSVISGLPPRPSQYDGYRDSNQQRALRGPDGAELRPRFFLQDQPFVGALSDTANGTITIPSGQTLPPLPPRWRPAARSLGGSEPGVGTWQLEDAHGEMPALVRTALASGGVVITITVDSWGERTPQEITATIEHLAAAIAAANPTADVVYDGVQLVARRQVLDLDPPQDLVAEAVGNKTNATEAFQAAILAAMAAGSVISPELVNSDLLPFAPVIHAGTRPLDDLELADREQTYWEMKLRAPDFSAGSTHRARRIIAAYSGALSTDAPELFRVGLYPDAYRSYISSAGGDLYTDTVVALWVSGVTPNKFDSCITVARDSGALQVDPNVFGEVILTLTQPEPDKMAELIRTYTTRMFSSDDAFVLARHGIEPETAAAYRDAACGNVSEVIWAHQHQVPPDDLSRWLAVGVPPSEGAFISKATGRVSPEEIGTFVNEFSLSPAMALEICLAGLTIHQCRPYLRVDSSLNHIDIRMLIDKEVPPADYLGYLDAGCNCRMMGRLYGLGISPRLLNAYLDVGATLGNPVSEDDALERVVSSVGAIELHRFGMTPAMVQSYLIVGASTPEAVYFHHHKVVPETVAAHRAAGVTSATDMVAAL